MFVYNELSYSYATMAAYYFPSITVLLPYSPRIMQSRTTTMFWNFSLFERDFDWFHGTSFKPSSQLPASCKQTLLILMGFCLVKWRVCLFYRQNTCAPCGNKLYGSVAIAWNFQSLFFVEFWQISMIDVLLGKLISWLIFECCEKWVDDQNMDWLPYIWSLFVLEVTNCFANLHRYYLFGHPV